MIEIKKYKINSYDCFDIVTDEGAFQIWFGGNLDLYFRYDYKGNILNAPNSKDFYITKENYFFYSLFDELYNDVKDYNIFTIDMFDNEKDWMEYKNDCLEHNKNNPINLFKDNKIEWHCDDFDYDDGSSFVIEKMDDCYKLTFNKCRIDSIFATYAVRIRNSGSRYGYFNIIFMRMYNKLCEYEPNFHQVHIEEYMYHKKLNKKKRLYEYYTVHSKVWT